MADDPGGNGADNDQNGKKTGKLSDLAKEQPGTKKVRIQTGTQTSQLDFAKRLIGGSKKK